MTLLTKHHIVNQLLLILAFIVISCPYAHAKENLDLSNVTLEVLCKDYVTVNEDISVDYVLDFGDQFNPKALELTIPECNLDCAFVKYFIKTSSNKSISMTNGKKTTTHRITWTATIKTLKEGHFRTPDVVLLHYNDTVAVFPGTKDIIITKNITENQNKKSEAPKKDDAKNTCQEKAIFRLETVLDKNTISLGDSVLMQIKFQSNQDGFNNVKIDPEIEIDDCFYEKIKTTVKDGTPVTVDGKACYEWIIAEYVLTPLVPGTITIPKIQMKGTYRASKELDDPFFKNYLRQFYEVPFITHSDKQKLKVK